MGKTFKPSEAALFEVAKNILKTLDPRVSFTSIDDTSAIINGVIVGRRYAVAMYVDGCRFSRGNKLSLNTSKVPEFQIIGDEYYYSGMRYSGNGIGEWKLVNYGGRWIVCGVENGKWFRYGDGFDSLERATLYLMGWIS